MAATDPIRRIRRIQHDVPLTYGVREALRELAELPPARDVPYVTVGVDWRPAGEDPGRLPAPDLQRSQARTLKHVEGSSRRPARQIVEQELNRLIADHGPRGDVFDSLTADRDRILAYLDDELDASARGAFIVANAARDVFTPLALGLPMPTRVTAGATPSLFDLARLVDDHAAYAVLLVDQHEAVLSIIRRAKLGRSVSLLSNDYPRHQQTGGMRQKRLQARAGERVAAFARGIADEVQRTLEEERVDWLVIAGDEIMTSALDQTLHQTVKAKILETIRLDSTTSDTDLIATTLPLADAAERERELAMVRRLQDAIGADGRGMGGVAAVTKALQKGQVATLVIVDDFAASGWGDYTLDAYGAGPVPDAHPLAGDVANLEPVELADKLIRLAVRTGAEIEIVKTSVDTSDLPDGGVPAGGNGPARSEAAQELDTLGGVGALLRFA